VQQPSLRSRTSSTPIEFEFLCVRLAWLVGGPAITTEPIGEEDADIGLWSRTPTTLMNGEAPSCSVIYSRILKDSRGQIVDAISIREGPADRAVPVTGAPISLAGKVREPRIISERALRVLAATTGRGAFYHESIGSILLALALSANTAFDDFPRLCRAVAQNNRSRNAI
jgi:hypothetical protein